ncbi:hypothetical protein [Daejeonella sp. H1SJ63]|uniref:hypothetical protein n=1 Tax=Daejeonella sp. H1SJ63 TaxID=3034145 RepID=UPI0023ECD852|nr:hypothetical protein [Daejeonella sp. H1SJ63]
MKLLFVFISVMIFASCANRHYPRFDYNTSKNPWIVAFKDRTFFLILKESYTNDSIIKLIGKEDAFNPYDALSPEAFAKAKILSTAFVKNMPPPLMCEGCKGNQNYYMANALHYYTSRDLDSIAHALYKKYRRSNKKIWGRKYP